jgi:adenylate kinase family enzyme
MYDKPFHSRLVPNVGDGRVQVIEYYTEKHKVTNLEANAPTSEVSRQIERALGF